MDSLFTLSAGDFRLVDLTLRLSLALMAGVALLLGLSTMCVERQFRFPLIFGSVALLGAAWFESGIARAWEAAFELAGNSYCVTGLPLLSEDRILAWAIGLPAIIFCFGLALLDRSSRAFRNLCWLTFALAVLGPVSNVFFLIGFLLCADQIRRGISPHSECMAARRVHSSSGAILSCRAALLGMVAGILLMEAGHRNLLPIGKTADLILVQGELVRSLGDILALVLPAAALLVCIFNLPDKEMQDS